MEYQIVIYSADEVFARMLELEFLSQNMTVLSALRPREDLFADVVILDLDSAAAPDPTTYRRMIGFTRGSAFSEDESRRQCSMILRRPFEMRLLRREVLGDLHEKALPVYASVSKQPKLALDVERSMLRVDGQKLALTPTETLVMQTLLSARGEPVSRERLTEVIGDSSANKTDVYICYLRRKLEQVTGVKIIRTVRGKGYLLM